MIVAYQSLRNQGFQNVIGRAAVHSRVSRNLPYRLRTPIQQCKIYFNFLAGEPKIL